MRASSSSPPPFDEPLSSADTTPAADPSMAPDSGVPSGPSGAPISAEPGFVMPPAFGVPAVGPTPAFGPGSGLPAPAPPPPSEPTGPHGPGLGPPGSARPKKRRRWLLWAVLLVGVAMVLGVVGAAAWWFTVGGVDADPLPNADPLPPFSVPVGISGRPDADRGFARLAAGDRSVCSTLRGVVVPPGPLSDIQADLRLGQLDCAASGLGDGVSLTEGAALTEIATRYSGLQRDYLEVIERAPAKAGPCVHVRLAELQLRMAVIAERAQAGAATVEQWTRAASASYRAARAVGALEGAGGRCVALAAERGVARQ